jgi:nicotinate-nucleotide pyrophosphorylase (carboxylating)
VLRPLEKDAVRRGGGVNHRTGLHDGILVKENHSMLAGGVGEAAAKAMEAGSAGMLVEIECATIDELREALDAGIGRILLDNMSIGELREAVELADGRAELEASGGITLENVRDVAETGVDYISVGALTHSAPALDLSLLLEPL